LSSSCALRAATAASLLGGESSGYGKQDEDRARHA
jgi:hypothetical protein